MNGPARPSAVAPSPPAGHVAPAPEASGASASLPARAATSLHIDRLVLEGFALSPRERARLQQSIEAELGALMQQQAPRAAAGGAVAALRAQDLRLDHAGDVQRLGRAIARSLHAELAR
ncbi:MAG TPA: hypothetical protein VJ743_10075 [Albitalea sp.]|nr:hypothetical protein [Albitalea sp.]